MPFLEQLVTQLFYRCTCENPGSAAGVARVSPRSSSDAAQGHRHRQTEDVPVVQNTSNLYFYSSVTLPSCSYERHVIIFKDLVSPLFCLPSSHSCLPISATQLVIRVLLQTLMSDWHIVNAVQYHVFAKQATLHCVQCGTATV